jgi:hypothetical protein
MLVGSIEIERDLPKNLRGAVFFFDTDNAFDAGAPSVFGRHRHRFRCRCC